MAKPTKYQTSLATTQALRATCAPIFLPLFDHCLALAAHSHSVGYPTRAGQELRHARKVAGYRACAECGQPIINGTDTCSADPSHVAVAPLSTK